MSGGEQQPQPEPVVARRLNGERLALLGWSRAILLQMSHPLIAAGVAQHSTFRGGAREAARRMHGTVGAMLALTFGEEPERSATLARIRGIHRTVTGTLPSSAGPFAAGTRYSAEDPELLLWVHATMLESIAMVYGLVVAPLPTEPLDRFCSESAPTLLALGGDPATVPRSWNALIEYMDDVRRSGALHVTPEGREIAEAVLSPRVAGLAVPGSAVTRLLTIGMLPPATREAYGFEWNSRRQKRLTLTIQALRAVRRLTPDILARWSRA